MPPYVEILLAFSRCYSEFKYKHYSDMHMTSNFKVWTLNGILLDNLLLQLLTLIQPTVKDILPWQALLSMLPFKFTNYIGARISEAE